MKHILPKMLAIASLAYICIFAVTASAAAPGIQSSASQHVLPAVESQPDFVGTITKKTEDDPVALYTFALTLFTAVLAISTIGLWVTTGAIGRRQSKDMRDALSSGKDELIISRRAYCFFESCGAQPEWSAPNTVSAWAFFPQIRNSGDTPAIRVLTGLNSMIFDGDLPADFQFPDKPDDDYTSCLVNPKGTIAIAGSRIDIADLARIATSKKKLRLIFWGWIEYDDIFDGTNRHRTEFCFEVRPIGAINTTNQITSEGIPFLFPNYKKHNAMDEDCLVRPRPFATIHTA